MGCRQAVDGPLIVLVVQRSPANSLLICTAIDHSPVFVDSPLIKKLLGPICPFGRHAVFGGLC